MKILKIAARTFNKTEEEITSKCRKQTLVYIRSSIAYLLRMEGLTVIEIGKVINRDHTTVVHLNQNHHSDIKIKQYERIYNELRQAYEDYLEDDRILFAMYLTGYDREIIEDEYESFKIRQGDE